VFLLTLISLAIWCRNHFKIHSVILIYGIVANAYIMPFGMLKTTMLRTICHL